MSRWARVALLAIVIFVAAQSFGALWMAHTWHRVWAFTQQSNGEGQVVYANGFSVSTGAYLDVFYLVAVPLLVVFLIWQHSAATVARGLGYPSRSSPAFGVASWFIPVINFWYPYWALCDTLPPDHPMRGRCLWAWLAYLGAGMAGTATFVAALASTTAAVVATVISGALALTAVGLGASLVRAVGEDHRTRMGTA